MMLQRKHMLVLHINGIFPYSCLEKQSECKDYYIKECFGELLVN